MTNSYGQVYDRESYLLIVDDDSSLLKFFKIHLNKAFSKVVAVKSGVEALEALQEKPVDMVLTDVRMPRLDGLRLMRKIQHANPAVPVMVVTGAMLDDEQKAIIAAEADGFLAKPFGVEELHRLIEKALALRETLKKLDEIVHDRSKLRGIRMGKLALDEIPAKKRREAEKLIKLLRPAG